MGLFSKKDAWTKLDEKAFGKFVAAQPEYAQLTRLIGPTFAAGSTKAMWNKWSMGGAYAQYNDKAAYTTMIRGLLSHEMKCVLAGHYHIGALQVRARSGAFTAGFQDKLMASRDFGAQDTDANADRAAAYIVYTSTSLRNTADTVTAPITRAGIKTALQNAAMYDVRSEVTLRDIHRRMVNQLALKPTRCMDPQAPYPSTGGAGYLLTKTFEFARGLPVKPANSPEWFDMACFLLGAVIRSHGFTDGNGRVGRAAYSAAMLKGGLNFVALKVDAEKLIHGLDQVA